MLEYGIKYKFKELCKVLEIEYKHGGKQLKNIINQISNSYEIIKDGTYYIVVKKLSEYEILERQKYNKHKEYIEPILYNILLNSPDNNAEYSMSDLFELLYLVNSNFFELKYNIITDTMPFDIYTELSEVHTFIKESDNIIRNIIKDILSDMVDRQLIVYDKILYYSNIITYYSDEQGKAVTYTDSRKCIDIPNFLNVSESVLHKYGYEKMSEVRYSELFEIRKEIASQLGIDYYYYKYNITMNKRGIKNRLDNMKEYIKLTNSYICDKLMNSKQGGLKEIDDILRSRLVDYMIRINI